jgi:hypothetical protein
VAVLHKKIGIILPGSHFLFAWAMAVYLAVVAVKDIMVVLKFPGNILLTIS